MLKSSRKKEFRLTPKVLLRLLIFFIIISFSIYYFSTQNINHLPVNPNVLGDQTISPSDMPLVKTIVDNLYAQLPSESRNLIENLNQSPVIMFTQSKLEFIKTETAGFPQKQVKDLKMFIIQKGQDLLKNAADKTK